MGFNLGKWLSDRQHQIGDVFNPNSAKDKQKRIAQGRPAEYIDQNKGIASLARAALGIVPNATKQAAELVSAPVDLTRAGIAQATKNKQASQNAMKAFNGDINRSFGQMFMTAPKVANTLYFAATDGSRNRDKLISNKGGLFDQGTLFPNRQSFEKIYGSDPNHLTINKKELAKKIALNDPGLLSDYYLGKSGLGLVRGAVTNQLKSQAVRDVENELANEVKQAAAKNSIKRQIAGNTATNFSFGTLGNAAQQYENSGQVSIPEALKSGATAAAGGLVLQGTGYVGGKGYKVLKENTIPLNEAGSVSLPGKKNGSADLSYQGVGSASGKANSSGKTLDTMSDQIPKLSSTNQANKKALSVINKVAKNPDAEVKIYRATPGNGINTGDWVFLTKSEAERFTKSPMGNKKIGFKVIEQPVKASDVSWSGKNLEFVYTPAESNIAVSSPLSKPQGFIAKETKPRNGVVDTVRVKNGKNGLERTIQSEPYTGSSLADSQMRVLDKPEVTQKLSGMGKSGEPSLPKLTVPNEPLNKTLFLNLTDRMLGERNAGRTKASIVADSLPKLTPDEATQAIRLIDSGGSSKSQKINQVVQQFRNTTDELYNYYKASGALNKNTGYVEDYLPRIYKHPGTGEAITKAEYDSLILGTGRAKSRVTDQLYEDALVSKDPRELLRRYVDGIERKKADLNYFNELKDNGFIYEAPSRPEGLVSIDAPGLPEPPVFNDEAGNLIQGNYYATPEVAKNLSKLFGEDKSPTLVHAAANINKFEQQALMSGGLPATPLNSFGAAQWLKASLAGHPISATKSFLRSFSKDAQLKYERENANYITSMEENGVPYRGTMNDLSALKSLGDEIADATGSSGKAKAAITGSWNRAIEDPTFKRFLPSLQLDTFKSVYDRQIKKGLSETEASQIAADATRNLFGINRLSKDALRSATNNDLRSALFFAPRFRESMVNFWINNLKALRHPLDPRNRENVKFMASATVLFGLMQAANEVTTGHSTLGNENKNDKYSWNIPTGNGNSLSIPFLSSTATIPRTVLTMGGKILNGDPAGAARDSRVFLGQTTHPVADVLANEQYNGRQVYDPSASSTEKLKQQGNFLIGQLSHPWIKATVDAAQGRASGPLETISTATELPIRFRDAYNPETTLGYAAPGADKSIKPTPLTDELNRLYKAGSKDNPLGQSHQALGTDFKVSGQKVTLNKGEASRIQKTIGNKVTSAWNSIINTPEYKNLSDQEKHDALQNIYTDIAAVEKRNFAAQTNQGPFAQNFSGKDKGLTNAQKKIATGTLNPTSYLKANSSNGTSTVKVADNVSEASKKTLDEFNSLDTESRDKYLYDNPSAEFDYELAKYENDLAQNKVSRAEKIRRESALAKLQIGKETPKEVRELYNLSKAQVYQLITTDPNGKQLADQLLAYGDALEKSGLADNKFRLKGGRVSFGNAKSSGSKKKSSGKKSSKKGRKGRSKLTPSDFRLPTDILTKFSTKGASLARNAKLVKTNQL